MIGEEFMGLKIKKKISLYEIFLLLFFLYDYFHFFFLSLLEPKITTFRYPNFPLHILLIFKGNINKQKA